MKLREMMNWIKTLGGRGVRWCRRKAGGSAVPGKGKPKRRYAVSVVQWQRVLALCPGPYTLTTADGYTVSGLSGQQLSFLLAELERKGERKR